MLQQAVGQVLANRFEMDFEDFSFGFRPNKNAQQAVLKALEYINSGYQDRAPILINGIFVKRLKGVPQGSPLSPILRTTITEERLQKSGYESLVVYYQKIAPFLNEPLFSRTGSLSRQRRDIVV
jgi:retron-type reverse transcriptase